MCRGARVQTSMLRALSIGLTLQGVDAWAPSVSVRHSAPVAETPQARAVVSRSADSKMCGILAVSGAKKSLESLKLETLV